MAAWHFAGFMRPLRMVSGPVHLFPLQSPHVSLPLSLPATYPPPPRLRTFCRVAITRQSPLLLGPLMDACCVGTGVPVGSMGCDRIHTRSVGFFYAEKTRVQLCKLSDCQEGFHTWARARSREYMYIAYITVNLQNESAS